MLRPFHKYPHRLVVRTSRCDQNIPDLTPGVDITFCIVVLNSSYQPRGSIDNLGRIDGDVVPVLKIVHHSTRGANAEGAGHATENRRARLSTSRSELLST